MAELKIKDILEFSLIDSVLLDKYPQITITAINKETKLPIWFLNELKELGYINCNNKDLFTIIKVAMFCMKSEKFIKNSINRLNKDKRNNLIKNRKKTKIEVWLDTYLSNKQGKIYVKSVYNDVCYFFPNYKKKGYTGYLKIKKIVKSFKNKMCYNKIKSNKKRLNSDL